eukprot:scaffold1868_cov194-Alexandrium_tamarense.AAC.36
MVPLVDVGFGTMCWLTWLDVGDVHQGLAKDDRGMVCRRRPSSVGVGASNPRNNNNTSFVHSLHSSQPQFHRHSFINNSVVLT